MERDAEEKFSRFFNVLVDIFIYICKKLQQTWIILKSSCRGLVGKMLCGVQIVSLTIHAQIAVHRVPGYVDPEKRVFPQRSLDACALVFILLSLYHDASPELRTFRRDSSLVFLALLSPVFSAFPAVSLDRTIHHFGRCEPREIVHLASENFGTLGSIYTARPYIDKFYGAGESAAMLGDITRREWMKGSMAIEAPSTMYTS